MSRQNLQIRIVNENVLKYSCDALILKYAQAWHGADLAVASALGLGHIFDFKGFVTPGSFKLVPGEDKLAAKLVLFEGVAPLRELSYSRIREFARNSLTHLQLSASNAKTVAMTLHGIHIGFDEKESFLAQLAGVLEALAIEEVLPSLQEIVFVEKNSGRVERLRKILNENYFPSLAQRTTLSMTEPVASAGLAAEKPHVFVAMPFSPDFEDTYIFGIQGPVQDAGLLCERVDMDLFTGDIVERIKSRIASARFVIADLTGSNPNVYLEVGYAWGTKVPAILLTRNPDELKFDVKGQRCLIYSSINDLNKRLREELKHHINSTNS